MLGVPHRYLREVERVVVTVPHVEQKGQDRTLVGADGLLVKLNGVFGLEIFGQAVSENQDFGELECSG